MNVPLCGTVRMCIRRPGYVTVAAGRRSGSSCCPQSNRTTVAPRVSVSPRESSATASESLTTNGICSVAAAFARTDRTIRSPTDTSVTTEPDAVR